MTSIIYTELICCLMKQEYIINRMSTQFVDDHIHIRGNSALTSAKAKEKEKILNYRLSLHQFVKM